MQMWLHFLSEFVKFRNVWRGGGCSGVLENPKDRHILSLRFFNENFSLYLLEFATTKAT